MWHCRNKIAAVIIALLLFESLVSSLLVGLAAVPVSAAESPWSVMSTGTMEWLNGVWGSSASDVFAVGGGDILRYNGSAWSAMNGGNTANLFGVWGNSASDVFAVGDLGTILHYNGSTWNHMISGTSYCLYSVWGSSASDVFAVGDSGANSSIIFHYNGSTWSPMSNVSGFLRDVWGTSKTNVFAVGGGSPVGGAVLLHYDGNTWSTMSSGASNELDRVWGSSASDVFAVGADGMILNYDGSAWTAMNSGVTSWLWGLWGNSASNVFAVGDGGTILHYNGGVWSAMGSGTRESLNRVWGTPTSDVFIVGGGGTILRFTPPSITSVNPSLGALGQSENVTITGTLLTGVTAVSFGPGITVSSFAVDSATQITANITVSAKATLGSRDVSVTTPSVPATLRGAFVVSQIPAVTPSQALLRTGKKTPTLTGTVTDPGKVTAAVQYRVDGTEWQTATFERDSAGSSSGSYRFSTFLPTGDHTVEIRGIDGAGNAVSEVVSVEVTITSGGSKAWVIVLIVLGGLLLMAGAGYLIWRYRGKIKSKANQEVEESKAKLSE